MIGWRRNSLCDSNKHKRTNWNKRKSNKNNRRWAISIRISRLMEESRTSRLTGTKKNVSLMNYWKMKKSWTKKRGYKLRKYQSSQKFRSTLIRCLHLRKSRHPKSKQSRTIKNTNKFQFVRPKTCHLNLPRRFTHMLLPETLITLTRPYQRKRHSTIRTRVRHWNSEIHFGLKIREIYL